MKVGLRRDPHRSSKRCPRKIATNQNCTTNRTFRRCDNTVKTRDDAYFRGCPFLDRDSLIATEKVSDDVQFLGCVQRRAYGELPTMNSAHGLGDPETIHGLVRR